jgi:predicted Zn-dependent peptidase
MPQTIALPDGLTLLVEELPHTHSVSVGCFVGVGSAHEQGAQAGISHLIEHMLFKGSAAYPSAKRISDAIEGVGGLIDAYTDLESTVYYAKVAHMHFGRALAVLADMLTRPLFAPQDLAKEQRVIAEELRQTADTPSEFVHLLLDASMWGDQPFGRDIAGDEQTVASLDVAQITHFWRQNYTRGNMILSVAGHVRADEVAERVSEAFRDLPAGGAAVQLATQPPQGGPTVTLRRDPSEQGNFCLGFPGLSVHDPGRRAMMVFDTVLGGGMASRLVQALREERGLAYNVGSESQELYDAGKWIVYASVEPERLVESLEVTVAELRRARTGGITAEELALVKEQVKGGMLLSLEDTWSVAARNGSHQLRFGRVIPIEQVVAEVEAVTIADVELVTARILRDDSMHLAVIGPYGARVERKLAKILRLA